MDKDNTTNLECGWMSAGRPAGSPLHTRTTDTPKHYCGLFGVYNHERAAELTYLGLYSLQHRGEESAGIAVADDDQIRAHKGMGLVGEVFDGDKIQKLKGRTAIGHVRYSTAGSSLLKNAQPQVMDYSRGKIAIAHNGNLTNAKRLRDELEAHGSIFQSTSDSEIVIHLMAKPQYRNRIDSLLGTLQQIEGAYSLVVLLEDGTLVGVRDPNGFRPLCLGQLGEAWILASETCALDLIEAKFIRELEPGEVLVFDGKGMRSLFPFKEKKVRPSPCIFELIYFARPDSVVFSDNVGLVRERLGMQLAKEHPVKADMVIPVPDSGQFAAIGYARQSGLPFRNGFTRNHYIGRTFIQPSKVSREFKIRMKLNPIREVLKGQRVIVVDDSIVRGNTARLRVKALREAGAREVHLRVSCPPHRFPCYYGIDFPDPKELLANVQPLDGIEKFLNADSVGYLSMEGMLAAVSGPKDQYCTCCFSGNYPVPICDEFNKFSMERGR